MRFGEQMWGLVSTILAFYRRTVLAEHPYMLALLGIAVTGIATTTRFLRPYYRAERHRLSIGFYDPSGRLQIHQGYISVTKGVTNDSIYVSLKLNPIPGNEPAPLAIQFPPSFVRKRELGQGVHFRDSALRPGLGRYYYYDIQPAPNGYVSFAEEFEAPFLSSKGREVDLDVFLDFLPSSGFPVDLQLSGLNGVTVSNVEPTPSLSSSYALRFELRPKPKGPSANTGEPSA